MVSHEDYSFSALINITQHKVRGLILTYYLPSQPIFAVVEYLHTLEFATTKSIVNENLSLYVFKIIRKYI